MARTVYTLRQFVIHSVLLAGCALFSFPFLWLLSTSAKSSEELGIFPPRWVPAVPWYAVRSPFVDGDAYDPMEPPKRLARQEWTDLRGPIAEALWRQAQAHLGPEALEATQRTFAGSDSFREQMVRGLWSQAREIIPDEVAADGLVAFVAKAVTPAMVRQAEDRILRRLAVGEVQARRQTNDIIPPDSVDAWEAGPGAALSPATIEGEACHLVAYDFADADTFTLRKTFRLPQDATDVASLNIPIHCDGSWHGMTVTLETGGRVYRSSRTFWVDIRSWQEVELLFKEPAFRGSRAIVLEPQPEATTDLAAPGAYRLTLTFEKSSRLGAAWSKYVDSYRWALRYIPFDEQLRNSVILVVLNVLGQLFACSLVAYGFARLRFWGRDVLFGLVLATMMLPGQVTMIPQFVLWKSLGWYNTLRPLWVPSWFGAAFFIFLMRQFFMTIPKELEDAAKIDGCGFFGIYWRIFLPLAAPAMATVAIFSFMGAWNEFVGPLVYLSDERLFPLSLGLNQFRQEQASEWAMLMAASTLMMLPVIGVFFFCQRYFIQGVTLTGMKG